MRFGGASDTKKERVSEEHWNKVNDIWRKIEISKRKGLGGALEKVSEEHRNKNKWDSK